MPETPLDAARRQAEECLKNWDEPRHDFASPGYANLRHSDAVDCVIALRALLAATAQPDATEHPCGCYAPDGDVCPKHAQSPLPDAVREAAERLRAAIAKHKTGCNCDACDSGEDLLDALAAMEVK